MSAFRLLRPSVGLALCAVFLALPAQGADAGKKNGPVLLSPSDGDRIPRPEVDANCPTGQACRKIFVIGRVAAGQTPFLAVTPLGASPQRIWIQPPIVATKPDGTFDGFVYLGTDREGVGEKFSIFVFGCPQKDRFKEADLLTELPIDCAVSPPVTVLRLR